MIWPHNKVALFKKSVLVLCLAGMCFPASAFAQDAAPSLVLRPHCEDDEDICLDFAILDPETRETDTLFAGDTFDIDLVIKNPTDTSVERVRAWISYDSEVLEGIRIDLEPHFSLPTPGENDFFPDEGYVKIGASADQELQGDTVVARIQFRVKSTSEVQTLLTFFDSESATESHTGIFSGTVDTERNLLETDPGHLLVHIDGETSVMEETSTMEEVPDSMDNTVEDIIPFETTESVFSSLQVQNLQVGTEGSTAFLAWDPLPSADLIGYNVYYGTVSGQYTQKRSTDAASTYTTIRNLPTGAVYYFAIRGAKSTTEETAYSQEVAVQMGSPGSSTSPLTGQLPGTQASQIIQRSPEISAATGLPSGVLLLIIASSVAGMGFAFRRQFSVSRF